MIEISSDSKDNEGKSTKLDDKIDKDSSDITAKYAEISPNKQYIRFEEIISKTRTIKTSYKAFDTLRGIEVSWHTVNLRGLSEQEQNRILASGEVLQELHNEYIMEYLHMWTVTESKVMNIITTRLDSLRELVNKFKIS